MALRGEAPGLVKRRRKNGERLYWSAANVSTKAVDYPERLIPLPRDASPAEIRDLCETYAGRLTQWLSRGAMPRFLYDGTVGSLCDAFERHPQSPIRDVRRNTADSYLDSLKVIRLTVAHRAVRAVAPIDVKAWYDAWRSPREKDRPERVKRAHDAIAALRMILRFGAALGYEECGRLDDGLAKLRFERSSPRQGEMTVDQVKAFVAEALTHGERGLYMAIGVAAQFETMLRQKDVIGEWGPAEGGGEAWAGPFTWENIPGGILRLRTSKTGAAIVHDLARLELLWPLMQMAPQAQRVGAVVKGEHGLPIRTRSYRKWFRPIARAAGIPDAVWNMDARAGAVTEALEAGAELDAVRRAATHSSATMTERYDRGAEAAVASVAAARKKARTKPGTA